jgi:excisionase family DNA binding protein
MNIHNDAKNTSDFISASEVAKKLNIGHLAVLRWCREGLMPGYKIGKLWRIKQKDLEEFIKKGFNEKST